MKIKAIEIGHTDKVLVLPEKKEIQIISPFKDDPPYASITPHKIEGNIIRVEIMYKVGVIKIEYE